jgi:hypothetical protein
MNKQQRLDWLPDCVLADMADACDESYDTPREALVIAFQMAKGLSADGWPGVKTAQALYGSGLPIARNRRELAKQVGDFPWQRTSKGRRIRWTAGKPDVIRVELHNGDFARIHRKFAAEFAAIFELACEVSGYTPESVQTYNPRRISGSDRLSMHSFGVAVDFDPQLNPMGGIIRKGPRKGEHALVAQFPEFLEVWRWMGWACGHDWKMIDSMHFQRKR